MWMCKMTNKLSLVEHKRVVVNKDGKEWLSVQRLHYTEDKRELVMIRPGDKRLELVLSEEEARTLIDAVGRAVVKNVEKVILNEEEWKVRPDRFAPPPLKGARPDENPLAAPGDPHYWHPDERPFYIPPVTCGSPSLRENQHTNDVVGDAYESSKIEN